MVFIFTLYLKGHGTHVAGIIAGIDHKMVNIYIYKEEEYFIIYIKIAYQSFIIIIRNSMELLQVSN